MHGIQNNAQHTQAQNEITSNGDTNKVAKSFFFLEDGVFAPK